VHNFTRECQSHWIRISCHTFVMLLLYRVKVSDTKVTHSHNISIALHIFVSITFRGTSIGETKRSRKSEAQNLCSKCPPFMQTHAFKRLHHCTIAAVIVVWSSSLHSLRRRSSTPSHHGSTNGRPSIEGYPRYCSPLDSNLANWMATSLEE